MPDSDARLAKLEKDTAVTAVRIEQICKEIGEIKNNHLVHINNELTTIHSTLSANQTTLLEQITNLRLIDAKSEPANKLVSEVIKYVILTVAAAILALVLKNQLQ